MYHVERTDTTLWISQVIKMSYIQKANDMGNPLGGVGLFHMIYIEYT